MITIQILNGKNEVVLSIRELFSCSIDEELNGSGNINISFPITDYSRKAKIVRGYKIKVYYTVGNSHYIQVFDGYIHKLTITSETVNIL
jgi:phage-related protein